MAFSHGTAGAIDRASIVRGDVNFISGTWTSISAISGTIETGGTTILSHGVTVGSAKVDSGTSKIVFSAKNQTGDGDAKAGMIRISGINKSATETSGDWWAITRV